MAIKYREIPSATESTLVLNSLQSYESGFYTCILTNDCGTVTTTAAELSVLNGEDYCEIYVTTFQELFDVSGISGTKDIILCPGTYTMTDNLTVPSTKTLRFLRGAVIATTGYTFTCNGVIQAGRQQIFSGTGATVLKDIVNPFWFGAVGDGTTNDTTAIQYAINSVTTKGGVVYFPTPFIYNIQSEITATSNYPISLISDMGIDNQGGSSVSGFISVGAAITGSIFKIDAPGGSIRNLYFKDTTSVLGVSQGTRAISVAAIEINKFTAGKIENCSFDGLLGSAIKSNNFIRGFITNPHIRDCGTPTQPALWMYGTSSSVCTQAVTVQNPRIEVCYGEYIMLDTYSYSNKVIGGQFEANTSIALSNVSFVYNKGTRNTIDSCEFNRNNGTQVYLYSDGATLSNCQFSSGTTAGYYLYVRGSNNVVTGNKFTGVATDTGTCIYDYGGTNHFTGNNVYYTGNIILGASSTWTGGGIYNLKTTENYAIVGAANSIINGTIISACDTCGGINASNTVNVSGNTVINNGDVAATPGIGILCGSTTALINDNRCTGNAGGDFSFTHYPHALSPDSNYAGDGVYVLSASTTWNPAEIANGASESKDVTVTGAAAGDEAVATFPMRVSSSAQAGMFINATVVGTNTVKVVIGNLSGGAVNLDSGTLYVKVTKK